MTISEDINPAGATVNRRRDSLKDDERSRVTNSSKRAHRHMAVDIFSKAVECPWRRLSTVIGCYNAPTWSQDQAGRANKAEKVEQHVVGDGAEGLVIGLQEKVLVNSTDAFRLEYGIWFVDAYI